jgi:hypothetical protein
MRLPIFQSVGTQALPAELTKPTELLDFKSPQIQHFIFERGWQALPEFERIRVRYQLRRAPVPKLRHRARCDC